MAFFGKLKFWKGEESLEPLKPLGGFEEAGFGKEPSAGFRREEGSGFGRDTSPDLGGTGRLEREDEFESRPIRGTPPEPLPQETDVSMYGQSYEKPPEPGELRHAPLAPMDRTYAPAGTPHVPKEIEIISAKIDAIKANVENINHRLESIERMMMTQQKNQRYQW